MEANECEWCHTPEARGGFGEILKKSELRWDLPREKTVGFCLLAETFVAGSTRVWGGGRWKGQNRKIVPLSPYIKEPLNLKVIKFRTWTKSSSFFHVSRFLCSVLYIYGHSMYVSHIAISWLWYSVKIN